MSFSELHTIMTDIINIYRNISKTNEDVYKKIDSLHKLKDLCFVYLLKKVDPTAPFKELPKTLYRLDLIFDILNKKVSPQLRYLFSKIVTDEFLISAHIKDPPFYLRSNYSKNTTEKKFNENILPLYKSIIHDLLHIN